MSVLDTQHEENVGTEIEIDISKVDPMCPYKRCVSAVIIGLALQGAL